MFCYNSFVAATAATIDDNVVVFVVFVIVDVVFFCGNQWKQSKEREQIINTSKAIIFGVSILMDSKRAIERERGRGSNEKDMFINMFRLTMTD